MHLGCYVDMAVQPDIGFQLGDTLESAALLLVPSRGASGTVQHQYSKPWLACYLADKYLEVGATDKWRCSCGWELSYTSSEIMLPFVGHRACLLIAANYTY